MQICILLFTSVAIIISNYVASGRIHLTNYYSSEETATVSPLSSVVPKSVMVGLRKQNYEIYKETLLQPPHQTFEHHQNRNSLKLNNFNSQNKRKRREIAIESFKVPLPKLLSNSDENDKAWLQQIPEEDLRERNDDYATVKQKRNLSKGKQKKAKVLGRLLVNNEDIQDDYIEDENDDYSRGANRKKMKWEDYRNEDGASVMELIALNARHKTEMRNPRNNDYFY